MAKDYESYQRAKQKIVFLEQWLNSNSRIYKIIDYNVQRAQPLGRMRPPGWETMSYIIARQSSEL